MRQDDVEIVDTEESSHDALAAYYADCTKSVDRYVLSCSKHLNVPNTKSATSNLMWSVLL
jgi:hypothetical protein